jgi:hypothetical protein
VRVCTVLGGPLDGALVAVADDVHVVHLIVRGAPPVVELDTAEFTAAQWDELGVGLRDGSAVMVALPVELSASGWVLPWAEPS